MLIENKMNNHLGIGKIYLVPGINEVDEKEWEKTLEQGYQKCVSGYQEGDKLVIHGTNNKGKIDKKLIRKTFDINILEEWLVGSKGDVRSAIKNQIKLVALPEDKAQ